MRLIDADNFTDEYNNDRCNIALKAYYKLLDAVQNAETKSDIITGIWVCEDDCQTCSNCGEEHAWDDFRASYCDACGAKMIRSMSRVKYEEMLKEKRRSDKE